MLKSVFVNLDKLLFGGRLMEMSTYSRQKSLSQSLEEGFECRFVVHYNKDRTNLISELCDRYGSDKGSVKDSGHPYAWAPHTYTDLYLRLFEHRRQDVKKVFECGLGTNQPDLASSMGEHGKPGASLRVWRDFFPNAQVFGADIDRTILFEETRIKTSYIDQTDPKAIADYWKSIGVVDFDVMIDDGLHTFDAGVCLLENSISKLAKGGVYVIEDVLKCDWIPFQQYFADKPYKVDFVTLFSPARTLKTPYDNTMIVIRNS